MTLLLDHWVFIICEFIDFVTTSKDILVSKIHGRSGDICVNVETSYFFIFQNIVGIIKNFRNRMDFFQVLLSTIFYKNSGTFN